MDSSKSRPLTWDIYLKVESHPKTHIRVPLLHSCTLELLFLVSLIKFFQAPIRRPVSYKYLLSMFIPKYMYYKFMYDKKKLYNPNMSKFKILVTTHPCFFCGQHLTSTSDSEIWTIFTVTKLSRVRLGIPRKSFQQLNACSIIHKGDHETQSYRIIS